MATFSWALTIALIRFPSIGRVLSFYVHRFLWWLLETSLHDLTGLHLDTVIILGCAVLQLMALIIAITVFLRRAGSRVFAVGAVVISLAWFSMFLTLFFANE